MGVGTREMGYLYGQYRRLTGHSQVNLHTLSVFSFSFCKSVLVPFFIHDEQSVLSCCVNQNSLLLRKLLFRDEIIDILRT